MITLLDALGSVHLSNKDFMEEKYHASRGKFDNETAARFAASFSRELPQIFGRVESSSSIQSSSSHPLPSVKEYDNFNSPVSHSGVKQRINDEMINVTATITSDISSRLAGLPISLMLANTFLVNARSTVDSLLTWMESFYQELQQGGQSTSKNAWLLVCSCVRCYFKELRKVRAPAQTASNMSSPINIAGAYLWSLAQSQRVSADFVAHSWREHPSIHGSSICV